MAYSATASTWKVGVATSTQAGLARFSAAGERWFAAAQALRVNKTATLTLTTRTLVGTDFDAANCDQLLYVVWSRSGNVLTPVLTVDVTADKGGTGTAVRTLNINTSVTIADGGTYYEGLMWHAPAGHTASRPILTKMNAGQGPGGGLQWNVSGASQPTTLDTATAEFTDDGPMLGDLTFTTTARVLYSMGYTAGSYLLPRRSDGWQYRIIKDLVITDGNALTFLNQNNVGGNASTISTAVFDFGATDQATFAGGNVALTGQAGHTFDLAIANNDLLGRSDLFWTNTSNGQGAVAGGYDLVTRSHYDSINGVRSGVGYAGIAAPRFITMSGTVTMASFELGWEPLVCIGDSQTTKLSPAIAAALTQKRMTWRANIGGSAMSYANSRATAGYLRFKHTTPGSGDLCDMPGVCHVLSGYGINDLAVISADGSTLPSYLNAYVYRVAQYANDARPEIIIGLPPHSAGDSNGPINTAIRRANQALAGIAVAVGASYVDPWPMTVVAGTENAAVPTLNAAYQTGDGLHYNDAGAAIVAAEVAKRYEAGTGATYPIRATLLPATVYGADGTKGAKLLPIGLPGVS